MASTDAPESTVTSGGGRATAGVSGPTRADIGAGTLRGDRWWLAPLTTFVVFFSFIVYRSRGQRDRINKKVMKFFMSDPKWKKYMDPKNMPFDGKRMFWGGFRAIVEY